ncbi:hypothetical protein CYMTET_9902 [Cymbomonas tetramitiformis]|uniref:Uncharacterized protein n=1 Tax=Cymbomonas tetramitiformis TaxID=36881 RepID=A0AAE0GQ64_9CHLO|nr:hypothetical protein CYMTET_9902 [Cymbomonas tetramitiformis]
MRKVIADVAKREWELLGLTEFIVAVRNFTHGEHIMFFRGASTVPGIKATMQSDERGHREDRRLVPINATHYQTLTQSVPALLNSRAFKNKETFSHGLSGNYPIPFLNMACELVSADADNSNFYLYPTRIHGIDFIYMNKTSSGKLLSDLRVSKFRQLVRGENPRNFFRSLDIIRKYSDDIVELTFNVDDPSCPLDGDACSSLQVVLALQVLPAHLGWVSPSGWA